MKNENTEKVKELIVLLSELSEGDEYFGATKINKLLFYIDFISYIQNGKPITGAIYEAQPGGPMLKDFYKIRDRLQSEEKLVLVKRNFGGYIQHKTIALHPADKSTFTGDEMYVISHVISDFRNMNAREISTLSHGFLGWQAVEVGEEIPYEIALVSTADQTKEEWEFPENMQIDFDNIGIKEEDVIVYAS